ncbi:MAG: hypothetical protein QM756_18620 [Polyangiaceae bacterium]
MTTIGPNASAAAPITNTDEEFLLGFQRVEAEVRAVKEEDLKPLNLDVPSTVTLVLGAWPEIRVLRDQVAALPGFNIGAFDKLRDYALALAHTHGAFRGLAGPPDGVTKLAEELTSIRDMLFADAMALAKRGVFDEARIAKLRSGPGYKSLAFDVVGLVQILRERWADIASRTGVQQAELDHAALLAQRLVTSVGMKEQQPVVTTGVALLRQQAFTLLVNAYDEVRRAISFLRWHEQDVESIAPSLWSGRGARTTPEAAPVANPAEPPPATGAAPATAPSAGAPPAASPVAVGLPGSPAFSRS